MAVLHRCITDGPDTALLVQTLRIIDMISERKVRLAMDITCSMRQTDYLLQAACQPQRARRERNRTLLLCRFVAFSHKQGLADESRNTDTGPVDLQLACPTPQGSNAQRTPPIDENLLEDVCAVRSSPSQYRIGQATKYRHRSATQMDGSQR